MSELKETLNKYFGYSDFIYPQEEVVQSVLEKKDTFAILPTGGGKSLCYQLPAVLLEGVTLVISPLIALMQDQVKTLNKKGISAALVSSHLSSDEISDTLFKCQQGAIKLLYVSPERLLNKYFIQSLYELNINLITVDEAHCISEWGHDFRPAYLKINKIRNIFPDVNILALTATAPPKTQEEIINSLHLKNVSKFQKSLKRNNLIYSIIPTQSEVDDLYYELKKNRGSSLVFTRTRKQTYEISKFLQEKKLNASFFHAKIPSEEKIRKQQEWMESDNQIMIATNAFGMGIDKANVRSVTHLNLPTSLEAYVQEAGRAGRDKNTAKATLFLQPHAVEEAESIFKNTLPTKNEFETISRMFYNYFEIGENERPDTKANFQLSAFIKKFHLNRKKTLKVLDFLERKEVILFQQKSNYSRIQIYINPKNFQFKKNIHSQIIEFLVRNHPGILSSEKSVHEFQIAHHIGKSIKKVKKALLFLNDAGYLNYQSRDVQSVYFLRPRETDFIRHTLWKEFEKLQISQWKKLQDIIYYATQTEICREKLILRYFGEKSTQNCGHCDVCQRLPTNLEPKSVLNYLEESPKTLQEILLHFVNSPKELVLEILQQLVDEERITRLGIDRFTKSKE